MAETKLARLTTREIEWLHILRSLTADDQDFLIALGYQIERDRIAARPSNVILLSDPFRKFPKAVQG